MQKAAVLQDSTLNRDKGGKRAFQSPGQIKEGHNPQ